jgi:hypothetical protein
MKNFLSIASAVLLACAVVPAHADTVTYTVTVNTSSQAGNGGYIDLELNAGSLGSQDITATVNGFTGATLNPADPNNGAINTSGSLPGPLSFDNQVGNDYFEGLTFDNQLSFLVTLSGDGVSTSGASTSNSGSIFQVSFFDPGGNALFDNDPNGLAAELDVAADGTLSTAADPNASVSVAATPEPASLSLVGMAGVLLFVAQRRRRMAE